VWCGVQMSRSPSKLSADRAQTCSSAVPGSKFVSYVMLPCCFPNFLLLLTLLLLLLLFPALCCCRW
jgi:hypothetical protein